MEFKPLGFKYVHYTDTDETVQIQRPKNVAHNLVMGQMYVDMAGEMVLTNLKRKEVASINFKGTGMFSKKKGGVSGKVCNAAGKEAF